MNTTHSFPHLFLLLLFSLTFISCEEEENQDPCEIESPCNRETVKEIVNTLGEVRYDDVRKGYHIIFSPAGTYNTQYLTIPCSSLGEEFKQEGTKVKITGEFKPVCEEIKPAFGGQEFYYLKISHISIPQD